jgi:hypothetical protein
MIIIFLSLRPLVGNVQVVRIFEFVETVVIVGAMLRSFSQLVKLARESE